MKYGWGALAVVAIMVLKGCVGGGRAPQQAQSEGPNAEEVAQSQQFLNWSLMQEAARRDPQNRWGPADDARVANQRAREQMIQDTAEAVRRGLNADGRVPLSSPTWQR